MMKHACGPCFDLVRKTGSEARCPDEPRLGVVQQARLLRQDGTEEVFAPRGHGRDHSPVRIPPS